MALGGVFQTDIDGNIGTANVSTAENTSGLLFDISKQANFWTTGPGAAIAAKWQNTVVQLNSLDDAEAAGLMAPTDTPANDVLFGVPYYHIKHYFTQTGGSGKLFVAFADCSTNWNAMVDLHQASNNNLSQIGIWTEQELWESTSEEAAVPYIITSMVSVINTKATDLANRYSGPIVVTLNANTSRVKNADTVTAVDLTRIPSCIKTERYVSILLGQSGEEAVLKMQGAIPSTTPIGNVGAALGCLGRGNVGWSIGWVEQFNVGAQFPAISMGFGDSTLTDGIITNPMMYEAVARERLDELDDKGYVMLLKYAGLEANAYFSSDRTCSGGDYNSLSRNRVINKSRRLIRVALLPRVNSPVLVDPTNGQLSAGTITVFYNQVSDQLTSMATNEEISGIGVINIPSTQNVLETQRLSIQYSIVPMGTSKAIDVEEAFAVSAT